MAYATRALIRALRQTIERLQRGERYQWSHQGACNCGHLVQSITQRPRAEIHALALEKAGDWGQKAVDYCPSSLYPIDHVITQMLEIGLTTSDIWHLERLNDPLILAQLPKGTTLQRNRRADVITYMQAWAELLTSQLGLVVERELSLVPA